MTHRSRHLRDCFGCFATGVTVATTIAHNGSFAGITVNSFSSVSLDPPLVLFCIDNGSSTFEAFKECRNFALNILTEQQIDLSRNFASPSADKWNDVAFRPGNKTAMPIIEGVLAYFECEKEAMYPAGDHSIVIGRVVECHKLSEASPLIYYKGSYRAMGEKL